VVPIPGSRRPAHIDENLAAAAIELSVADLAEIDAARHDFAPTGRSLLDP
jgi:diketogulonate reductase-like aldo/keto reductase